MKTHVAWSPVLFLVGAFAAQAEPLTVQDYRGASIAFPQGAISFADKVLFANTGTPGPTELKVPDAALGVPDWSVPDTQRSNFPNQAYSLGCRGSLAVQFEDNALIDGPGDDLFIFEVGANIEGSRVSVSNDGQSWEAVGDIGGAFATIDLAKSSLSSNTYRYVLIEDLGSLCTGITPGADIDAIGAIGSADRLTLNGSVLFDFSEATLRTEAQSYLRSLLPDLVSSESVKIEIVGHTDSVGSDSANLALGDQRASNVAQFLVGISPGLEDVIVSYSRGEAEPIASNTTDVGRQQNRRVEVTIFR